VQRNPGHCEDIDNRVAIVCLCFLANVPTYNAVPQIVTATGSLSPAGTAILDFRPSLPHLSRDDHVGGNGSSGNSIPE
jgi:hypothetical protein